MSQLPTSKSQYFASIYMYRVVMMPLPAAMPMPWPGMDDGEKNEVKIS